MKVSREQVAASRKRILEAAGRLFRERGFEGVTVAEVMHAAGLTHGGFYGYFKSKDDLIVETLAELMSQGKAASRDLADFATAYLAPEHRDDWAGGCGGGGARRRGRAGQAGGAGGDDGGPAPPDRNLQPDRAGRDARRAAAGGDRQLGGDGRGCGAIADERRPGAGR
ncbi:MAG: helix-turn-helix domain-containing protein [Caulobacteraceae bacterium]